MQELEKILEEIDNAIEDYSGGSADNGFQGFVKGLKRAKKIIRKHMNDGWIPVGERLPIPNKEVWVTAKRNGNVFVSTDTMTEKGHFWNYEKENILAWKEKDLTPEPYRPKRS